MRNYSKIISILSKYIGSTVSECTMDGRETPYESDKGLLLSIRVDENDDLIGVLDNNEILIGYPDSLNAIIEYDNILNNVKMVPKTDKTDREFHLFHIVDAKGEVRWGYFIIKYWSITY